MKAWFLEFVLTLLLGVPAFLLVGRDFGLIAGASVSLLLMGSFLGLVLLFGQGSTIEAWVPMLIVLILILILAPVFKRAHEKALHQHHSGRPVT